MIIEFLRTVVFFYAPGYVLSGLDRRLDAVERFCAAVLASTLLYGSCALVLHAIGVQLGFDALLGAVTFATVVVYLSARKWRPEGLKRREAAGVSSGLDKFIVVLVLALALRVALFELNPNPVVGDSYAHYSYARSFLTAEWFTTDVIDNYWTPYTRFPFPGNYRPPLQDFLHALGMVFNGVDYASAVSINVFFGVFLVLGIYLLATRLFNHEVGWISGLLVSVNFFLISRSIELEPRVMVSFFVTMMVYFTVRGRGFSAYAALSAAFAYLTHYTAVWFIIAVVVYQAIRNKYQIFARENIMAALIFIVVLTPWFVRNYTLFGNPLYTTARYVPFMTKWDEYQSLTPPTPTSYLERLGGGVLGVLKAVMYRLINMVTTYVPPPNKMQEYGFIWTMSNSVMNLVSLLAFTAAILYILSNLRHVSGTLLFFVLAFSSFVGPLWTGYPKSDGVSVDFLSPLTPIFLAYAAAYIVGRRGVLLTVIVLSMVAQTALLSGVRISERPDLKAMNMIGETVPEGSIIMSEDGQRVNFYTGLLAVIPPYEGWDRIVETARAQNVSYYIFTQSDGSLRDVDKEKLGGVGELVWENERFSVYRLV
ncbi:MAG: glycosyltransferase family 39 protein [Candidatus Altiarchaeota archaeon]